MQNEYEFNVLSLYDKYVSASLYIILYNIIPTQNIINIVL